ncbi:hypothetical protein GJAV_G00227330 [Gymnothorax javanicus]|nr:hypothetical protein GJAV_G00227330 [Gymnothorax javanicus]
MRLQSKRIHQCITKGTWWHSWPCLRPHNHSLQLRCSPAKDSMDQTRRRANTLQTCLRFWRTERDRMEQKRSAADPLADRAKGRLEELALRWFTETQAPLILHEGNFPAWFHGFITRKEAEAKLTDKPVGFFLIRLSDKAIGYILSYRGRDRCRHFVINQNKAGHFIISGDTKMHENLTDLIEHYRTSPIEPFGEFLSSSYPESSTDGIYDEVQADLRERTVSVNAVRNLWQRQSELSQSRLPALPPKSYNQRSKPLASRSMEYPLQAVPPVPRRAPYMSTSLDETGASRGPLQYAQLQKRKANPSARPSMTNENASPDNPRSLPGLRPTAQTPRPKGGALVSPGVVYSELSLEHCRSRSLPLLDSGSEESSSYSLSTPPFTSPHLSPNTSKRAKDQACSLSDHGLLIRTPAGSSDSIDDLCSNSLYQLAGMPHDCLAGQRTPPGRPQARPPAPTPPIDEGDYAEVPYKPLSRHLFLRDNTYEMITDEEHNSSLFDDSTYELIPEQGVQREAHSPSIDHRDYQSIEDQLPENTDTYCNLRNDKWRRFIPE